MLLILRNCNGPNDQLTTCLSPPMALDALSCCQYQSNCSFYAESTLFTDPCPGTFKYAEVDYTCLAPCGTLPLVPHGTWNSDNVIDRRVGSFNVLNCQPGYVPVPLSPRLTCMSNSQWDHAVPRCDPATTGASTSDEGTCASLAIIPNGHWNFVSGSISAFQGLPVSYAAGASNQMTCDDGYLLVGDAVLTCINRQWDKPLPRCDPNPNINIEPTPFLPEPLPDLQSTPNVTVTDPTMCNWQPISFSSGLAMSPLIPLGFSYTFFGQVYQWVSVSPLGFLKFSNDASLDASLNLNSPGCYANYFLHGTSFGGSASYRYCTKGTSGNHQFILSITGVPSANVNCNCGTLNVQVKLIEMQLLTEVEFHYASVPLSPSTRVTVGIQCGTLNEALLTNQVVTNTNFVNQSYAFRESNMGGSGGSCLVMGYSCLYFGLVVGAVGLVAIFLIILCACCCRRRQRKQTPPPHVDSSYFPASQLPASQLPASHCPRPTAPPQSAVQDHCV
jgi:hypothetical protein